MEQNTQTNRADVEYISIYDKQKKAGRPKGVRKYTEEEQLLRRRQANMKHYCNNHEYYKSYKRLHKADFREASKNTYYSLLLFFVGFGLLISL